MTIERRVEVINASGRLDTSAGNFCLLISTIGGTVNLRAERGGSSEGFNGVTGGLLIRRVKSWDNLVFAGAAGITVEFLFGYENVEEDETDVRLQIATIAGVAAIAEQPSSVITSPAVDAIATASALSVAANLTRRRITFCSNSNNTGSVFIQLPGAGANRGIELQPGLFIEIKSTAAIDVRNDSGATQNITRFEES